MKNFELSLPLVNGSLFDVYYGQVSGKDLIHSFAGDDFGPPPQYMRITVSTPSGRKISLHVPYDDKSDAVAFIDDEII